MILNSCQKDGTSSFTQSQSEESKADLQLKKTFQDNDYFAATSFPWPCYWNPDPCSSCVVTCDVCTFYYYCGPNPECNIFVTCSKTRYVKILESINVLAASNVGPTTGPGYWKVTLASNFNGTTDLEVRDPFTNQLLCSDSKYYNCQ